MATSTSSGRLPSSAMSASYVGSDLLVCDPAKIILRNNLARVSAVARREEARMRCRDFCQVFHYRAPLSALMTSRCPYDFMITKRTDCMLSNSIYRLKVVDQQTAVLVVAMADAFPPAATVGGAAASSNRGPSAPRSGFGRGAEGKKDNKRSVEVI